MPLKYKLSQHQVAALRDARGKLLYKTVSGWRCQGGGLHGNHTVDGLIGRGLLRSYPTQTGTMAAFLTKRGEGVTDRATEGRR